MIIDIVSDLHIDQWNQSYNIKYPCGSIIKNPFHFTQTDSDILIIAGDISDDMKLSIKYLDKISSFYKKILFVDGNHEHVNKYPFLYSYQEINKELSNISNDKLIFLREKEYIYNDTVIIGCSGWWDYYLNGKKIEEYYNYFDNWIPKMANQEDNITFINSVKKRCESEYKYLEETIIKYQNLDTIKKIIIVTHTIPELHFDKDEDPVVSCNSKFSNLVKKYNKISYWIFGHTHNKIEKNVDNIKYICNPRGRPEDNNLDGYCIRSITI